MFLNRSDELAQLRRRLDGTAAELLVVYGRRRVGKTELLTQLATTTRSFYFEATNTVARQQLADLSAELARVSGNPLLAEQPMSTWDGMLTAIGQFVGDERTLVVLDEFQYLADQSPELETAINRWWRQSARQLPIVLVLAGSELSFFEDRVLAGQLYGRRTGQLRVEPFIGRDAALFHPGYGPEDRVRAYSICGGVPYYLERFGDDRVIAEHLLNDVLDRSGLLHDEAELLLRQSLADTANHTAVLRAIAHGQSRNNDIAQRTGLSAAYVTKLLVSLERLGLVRQWRPVTSSPRAKKTSYALADHFLRFHYRFIEPARTRLRTTELARRYRDSVVLADLDHHASLAWEDLCRDHVLRTETDVTDVGRWWGRVPTGVGRQVEQREIDVVAVDGSRRPVLFGMCTWTARAVGFEELNLLDRLIRFVPGATGGERRVLFSRMGFTKRLGEHAAGRPDLELVTPGDLYR